MLPALAVSGSAGLIAAGRLLATGWPFDRLWAEDGAVFLADALEHGWRSVGYSYAGYMHGLPRVLTLAGSRLPLPAYANYAVVVSVLVCALTAGWVYGTAREVTGSTRWAALAALATVSAPGLRVESLGSLANLQWFLLYGALWSCLARPGALRWWPQAALGLVAAVTTPLTVLLAPVLLLHRRQAVRSPVAVGIGTGLVLQAASRLVAPRSEGRVLDRSPGVPDGLARTYLDAVAGMPAAGTTYAAGAFGCLVLLAGLAALGTARHHRSAAVVVALVGAALFAGTSVMTNAATGRYIGVGTLFLWAALVLAASAARAWAASAVTTLVVTAAVLGFPADPFLLSGPSWGAEVARATTACAEPDLAQVTVPLSPEGWGTMTLACSDLR